MFLRQQACRNICVRVYLRFEFQVEHSKNDRLNSSFVNDVYVIGENGHFYSIVLFSGIIVYNSLPSESSSPRDLFEMTFTSPNMKIKFWTTHNALLYALTRICWYTVKETVWDILKKRDEFGRHPKVAHPGNYVKLLFIHLIWKSSFEQTLIYAPPSNTTTLSLHHPLCTAVTPGFCK